MSMVDKQWVFVRNIAKLIEYAEKIGVKLTFGEAYRTREQQMLYFYGKTISVTDDFFCVKNDKRKSWTMKSKHLERLAVDFNFFIDGKLTYDYKNDKIRELGRYWESLDERNRWGGNFKKNKDTPHFEMS